MFKSSFWGLVATAILLGACTGEIGGLAGDARFDTASDLVAELSASNGWRSIEASEPAFDTVRFDVMARPEVANIDALVAMGADEITDLSDASIKVRFADDGFIDARDGSTYKSDHAVRYRPGVWYKITISANVAARTYDVAVGGRGERAETLITGAAFDSQAVVTDRLTTWAAWSSQSARLDIARHSWVASGSCAPSTCLSLGVLCGEPSDGCGGNLSCGSCGSGQTCDRGVCEDVPPPPSPEPPPPPSCEPATCVSLGMECGDWGDGCGGYLSCGGCGSGQTCTSGVCVDVVPPSPPPCEPATCTSWGVECGRWSDGCGGELGCGGCGSGRSCTSGVCVDVQPPPPPPCEPATCLSLGKECGSWDDGCGGTLSCGGCTGSDLCSAAGTCYDPSPPPCIPDCAGKECGDDGCGGFCGTCSGADACNNISGQCIAPVGLIWTDSIQSGGHPHGFDGWYTESPIGNLVTPDDSNGANLSRVSDPDGGPGYALRQYGVLDQNGARSELGIWSFRQNEFGDLALSGAPVYVAQEWYFAETIEAGGDSAPWLSLLDWHSTGDNGSGRWHTCPGLMLKEDGSMRFQLGWGCHDGWTSDWSNIAMPVGEWFDIEIRWQRATGPTATVSVWINGELAVEQVGVVTARSDHSQVEFYIKLYGSDQGHTPWSPRGNSKYVRNVRISGERIWR